MHHKVSQGPLLNEKGELNEAGYAFDLIKEYSRKMIKAPKWRIKEWDYYYIGNNHHGVAFTIDDNCYMGLGSVSILDFDKKSYITKSEMKAFTNCKINLPCTSKEGVSIWDGKNYKLKFEVKNGKRIIDVDVLDYDKKRPFKAHFELKDNCDGTMVIITPFKNKKQFYYNQKINCIKAKGYYEFAGEKVEFEEKDTRAVLDWGRGVWPYKNTWFWSSLNGVSEGHEVGFNLGYGFGDTGAASENMLFYDGKAYKLDDVAFNIPKDKEDKYLYMKEWTLTSKDGNINLHFQPIVDRKDCTDVILIKSLQHQVFGTFNGTIKINDITAEIKDVVSFAEVVTNWW